MFYFPHQMLQEDNRELECRLASLRGERDFLAAQLGREGVAGGQDASPATAAATAALSHKVRRLGFTFFSFAPCFVKIPSLV